MDVYIFNENDTGQQVLELRRYFHEQGAEILPELSGKGIEDDMHKIIGVCDANFARADCPEGEIEGSLNSIVSVLMLMPMTEKKESLIVAFCEKLQKAPSHRNLGSMALRTLYVLFHSMIDNSCLKYHIYLSMIQVSGQIGEIGFVYRNLDKLKQSMKDSQQPPSTEQYQALLRNLHKTLVQNNMGDDASSVMLELLGTYTAENASQARDDAHYCITESIKDPSTFILDHLLALKPVRFLEGELLHDLLNIFVHEKLEAYLQFYSQHREFVAGLGLCHAANCRKMRVLTFVQLAQLHEEMSFHTLQQELKLQPDQPELQEDQIEEQIQVFIVEALKTKLVVARMDQLQKKVVVTRVEHRTFGLPEWQKIGDTITRWRQNIATVKEQMTQIINAPTVA